MTAEMVIGLAIDILVGAAFIWLGMKFTARVIAGMQPDRRGDMGVPISSFLGLSS